MYVVFPTESRSAGRIGVAAGLSTAVLLPLLILDWLNRDSVVHAFPTVLFAVLWLLPFAFVLLAPAVVRPSQGGAPSSVRRLLTAVCLIVIAWFWGAIVIDQMPCFLGVPNCD